MQTPVLGGDQYGLSCVKEDKDTGDTENQLEVRAKELRGGERKSGREKTRRERERERKDKEREGREKTRREVFQSAIGRTSASSRVGGEKC